MRRTGSTAALTITMGCLVAAGAAAATAVTAGHGSSPPGRHVATPALDVLPFPGTPDAAPGTHIDLPAASPARIESIVAVGSHSGLHAGHLCAQPAGNGTTFTPDQPFSPGERVSVTATFRSPTAGTTSGAPGAKQISFSFSIARGGRGARSAGRGASSGGRGASTAGRRASSAGRRASSAGRGASSGGHSARIAARVRSARIPQSAGPSESPTHSFVTHPGFRPPVLRISRKDPDLSTGDIFLDAQNTGQSAGYILNPRGSLLWYRPAPSHASIRDVRVQSYQGNPVLTFWQGGSVDPPGGGRGKDLILNRHYQTIHTLSPGNGLTSQGADSHEFLLGHEGKETTAFMEIWRPTQANLTSVGGPPNGPVYDWIIQELDIATGKVIWEWHALGHVPVKDSYLPYRLGQRYEYFHLNSIQQLSDGNILISARNTWAVYLINKKTGRIMWRLGGKHSSFKMGPHTNFEWQHDAILHANGLLTLFDDASNPKKESQSRALKLHLSTKRHRATLVHQYRHSPPTLATSEGSVQLLPNHNVFVGWGSKPYFTEYSSRGKQLFGGSFVSPVNSYRAYRFNWVGVPLQPPVIAARPATTAGEESVYASWNGSTQVRKWQVLSSSKRTGPFVKARSPALWSGFETKMHARKANFYKIEALNSQGGVLGTSAVVPGR